MAKWISPAQPGAKPQETLVFSAWIHVDLSAIEKNLQVIQQKSQAQILPIVKGNAYGHGAPVIAAFLRNRGCSLVGVGSLEEALDILRFAKMQILVLTPVLYEQLKYVVKHELHVTVTTPQQVLDLAKLAQIRRKRITVHIKVDTGFGRLGSTPQDFPQLAQLVQATPFVKLGGVFTHFSKAAVDHKATLRQPSKLLRLKEETERLWGPQKVLWHAANSAAFATLPASHLDLARVGTLLYGQAPLALDQRWELEDTWQFRTRIIQIRNLPKGHLVGYGGNYRTKKPTRVAVIPVGYGHGLDLAPQGTPWRQFKHILAQTVRLEERILTPNGPLPIIGRIGMGLSCVDLSKEPQLTVGDELTVNMRRVTASSRVPRIYYLKGQAKCIFWNGQIYDHSLVPANLQNLL